MTQFNAHMKFAVVAMLALLGAAHPSNAQQLKYLGLELGVSRPPFPVCTTADSGAKSRKRICWISKPFIDASGDKLGPAYIPDQGLPNWAAYSMFNLHVTKKNAIRGIDVDRPAGCSGRELDEVIESISSQFGPSSDIRTALPVLMRWDGSQGYLQLLAYESACKIQYRSPELQTEVKQEGVALKNKEQARPKTP